MSQGEACDTAVILAPQCAAVAADNLQILTTLAPQAAADVLPFPNVRHTPWLCTGAFCESMRRYLESDVFSGRIFYVNAQVQGCADGSPSNIGGCHLQEALAAAQGEHPEGFATLDAPLADPSYS